MSTCNQAQLRDNPSRYPENRVWDFSRDLDSFPVYLFPSNADTVGPPAFDYEDFHRDVAYNGMYFVTEEIFRNDDNVDIKIYLSGTTSDIFVSLQGSVLGQEANGVSVQFNMDSIDMDALTVLRYVLAYNGMDDDQVLKEYNDFQNRETEPSIT